MNRSEILLFYDTEHEQNECPSDPGNFDLETHTYTPPEGWSTIPPTIITQAIRFMLVAVEENGEVILVASPDEIVRVYEGKTNPLTKTQHGDSGDNLEKLLAEMGLLINNSETC